MENRYYLDTQDGKLCVRCEMDSLDRPETHIVHWPISNHAVSDWTVSCDMIGEQLVTYDRCEHFHFEFSDRTGPYTWLRDVSFCLVGGASAKPIATTTVNLSPPRVRKGTETRWSLGKWEKRLKRGWVTA